MHSSFNLMPWPISPNALALTTKWHHWFSLPLQRFDSSSWVPSLRVMNLVKAAYQGKKPIFHWGPSFLEEGMNHVTQNSGEWNFSFKILALVELVFDWNLDWKDVRPNPAHTLPLKLVCLSWNRIEKSPTHLPLKLECFSRNRIEEFPWNQKVWSGLWNVIGDGGWLWNLITFFHY